LLKNHTIKPNKNFTSAATYVIIIVEVKAMLVNKGRGYVYYLRYHIVFCTKYRHKIIEGQIETRLKEMFQSLARVHKFEIVTTEVMPDHVHLLVDCTPQHYIPDILKALKGNTARFLLKEFPELRKKIWGGHIWNPSYFVASIGENTEEAVKKYIESQKESEKTVNKKGI
jgi:putative transposase